MAYGKSLEKEPTRKYRIWHNNGKPIARKVKQPCMSKKERRRQKELMKSFAANGLKPIEDNGKN